MEVNLFVLGDAGFKHNELEKTGGRCNEPLSEWTTYRREW